MEYRRWEPIYRAICRDFGFDPATDRRARDRLHAMTPGFDGDRLPTVAGRSVAITAPGEGLAAALADLDPGTVVVAAGGSLDRVLEQRGAVDLLVTDLDGHRRDVADLSRQGIPLVIHAHGDNIAQLEKTVPRCNLENVLPTTQVAPRNHVRNPGGFTDGDRAAFLVDELGAGSLQFPGWDLSDDAVGPIKRRKLEWAARLLAWLEDARGEQFDCLDGLRDGLAPLPP